MWKLNTDKIIEIFFGANSCLKITCARASFIDCHSGTLHALSRTKIETIRESNTRYYKKKMNKRSRKFFHDRTQERISMALSLSELHQQIPLTELFRTTEKDETKYINK